MQIQVISIRPCDYLDDPDFPKMEAEVFIKDTEAEYPSYAKINVFIDKRDAPLSELKLDAIQKAKTFLQLVLSAHSS